MPYIVDGHNLVPKIPGLRLDAPDDEQQLVSLLQEFCRLRRARVDVYFDKAALSGAGQRSLGMVAVHFVRAGQIADEAIRRRLLKMGRSARNWTVVSSDHAVQASARQVGAKPMPAEEFAALLTSTLIGSNQKDSSDVSLGDDEVDEWLKLFRSKSPDDLE
jgi:predicted RNA-binding protein with PIN domain